MTIEWEAGRLDSELDGVGLDTLAVRAGQRRTPEAEHGEPLFFTSSYVFRSAADAAARFAGDVPGNVYSRYTNPTVRAFEERIAALEGAEQAVAATELKQRFDKALAPSLATTRLTGDYSVSYKAALDYLDEIGRASCRERV